MTFQRKDAAKIGSRVRTSNNTLLWQRRQRQRQRQQQHAAAAAAAAAVCQQLRRQLTGLLFQI